MPQCVSASAQLIANTAGWPNLPILAEAWFPTSSNSRISGFGGILQPCSANFAIEILWLIALSDAPYHTGAQDEAECKETEEGMVWHN